MNVEQLIKALSKYPPAADVVYGNDPNVYPDLTLIYEVNEGIANPPIVVLGFEGGE